MSEHTPGNYITNGAIRWRPRQRAEQSETLFALDWDSAEKALCEYSRVSEDLSLLKTLAD